MKVEPWCVLFFSFASKYDLKEIPAVLISGRCIVSSQPQPQHQKHTPLHPLNLWGRQHLVAENRPQKSNAPEIHVGARLQPKHQLETQENQGGLARPSWRYIIEVYQRHHDSPNRLALLPLRFREVQWELGKVQPLGHQITCISCTVTPTAVHESEAGWDDFKHPRLK